MKTFVFLLLCFSFVLPINAQEVRAVTPSNSNQTNRVHEIESVEEELEIAVPETSKKRSTQTNSKSITQTQKIQQFTKALRIFNEVEQNSNQNTTQRNPTAKEQQVLQDALSQMEETKIMGVDFYLAHYKAGNYDMEKLTFLEKAYQLDPANKEVIKQLTGAYFILENTVLLDQKLTELDKRNVFNPDYYAYARDVVVGLKPSATLISHGENDTYPLIKVLREQNRRDVTLVNLDFLQSRDFRNALTKKGYKLPKGELINANYLNAFCSLNSAKNIQIAYSVPKNYLQNIASSLYVSGLTFHYSKSKLEVFAPNEYFFEQVRTGQLLQRKSALANQLKSNYLPVFLILKTGYVKQNNAQKVKEINQLISQIALESNKQQELKRADMK